MPHLDPPLETEIDDDGLEVPDGLDTETETDVDEMSEEEVRDEFEDLFDIE
jgi:hypothetical protein